MLNFETIDCDLELFNDSKSPLPPCKEEIDYINLTKECPICLSFMTEPCRLPNNICEHRLCLECMISFYEEQSKKMYKVRENGENSMIRWAYLNLKCPLCRAQCFVNEDDQTFLQVDIEYQNKLREAFEVEFQQALEETQQLNQDKINSHEIEYLKTIEKLHNEKQTLTFEIGIRQIIFQEPTYKINFQKWQEYVRIQNPKYQNIIDKIVHRVDYKINETNVGGNRNPIVVQTNNSNFRNLKRKYIKENKVPEIAMQPIGGTKNSTKMPKYLPVKLYFNKIDGLECKEREIVHEDLTSGQNNILKFRVQVSKKALDELLQ